jgi:RTX calcium-binding nonapeptide repeat (4 copies)
LTRHGRGVSLRHLLLIGSATAGLALIPGAASGGFIDASCTYRQAGPPGPKGNVLRAVSDLDLTIGRRGRRIEVIDTLQDSGGDPVTCSGGTPTVSNVDRIVVEADDADIDLSRGRLEPGATRETSRSEIEVRVSLDERARLGVMGGDRRETILIANLRGRRAGLNLNADADFDLVGLDFPRLKVLTEGGPDLIHAAALGGYGGNPSNSPTVVFDGGDGDDRVFGTPGGDFWLADGNGDDVVRGGRGADNLRVYRGRDAIFAGPGNDLQLFQFAGTESRGDRIFGGRGNDALDGRNGAPDAINCGRGRDEVLATREDTLLSCERRRFL